MMEVFLHILQMSRIASWLIIVVCILRVPLKRVSKNNICILWAMVAVRLICPIAPESKWSLVPSNCFFKSYPQFTGEQMEDVVSGNLVDQNIVWLEGMQNGSDIPHILHIATYIWMIGLFLMGCYVVISYIFMIHKTREAVECSPGVWLCDHISTPFLMGIFHPRIVIPSQIMQEHWDYVLRHEQMHIKRKDHLWKPLGFAILSVYWFHPIIWIAYILFSRDLEFACDECVLQPLNEEERKCYIKTVLTYSISNQTIGIYGLGLGEVGVKSRITEMLRYRKTATFVIVISFLVSAIVTFGFMINPERTPTSAAVLDNCIENTENGNSEKPKENLEYVGYIQNDNGYEFEPIYMNGSIIDDTSFLGEIVWLQPEGEVFVQAITYANVPGVSEPVCMEHIYTSIETKHSRIDSNHVNLKDLGVTYTLSGVEFIFHVYHDKIHGKQGEGAAVWVKYIEKEEL